jgi:hypothetical protein
MGIVSTCMVSSGQGHQLGAVRGCDAGSAFVLATPLATLSMPPATCAVTKPLRPQDGLDDDDALEDNGRSIGLRLLALVGAFSFLMLGVSSVVLPLMNQPEAQPPTTQGAPSAGQGL